MTVTRHQTQQSCTKISQPPKSSHCLWRKQLEEKLTASFSLLSGSLPSFTLLTLTHVGIKAHLSHQQRPTTMASLLRGKETEASHQ